MIQKIKMFIKNLFESKLYREVREFEAFLTSHLEERKENLETIELSCDCDLCNPKPTKTKKPSAKKTKFEVTKIDPSKGLIEIEEVKPAKVKKPRAKKASTPRKPRRKGVSND